MNNSNRKEFGELVAATAEIYSKVVSKTLMKMYFDDLKEYDIKKVVEAFRKHRLDPEHGAFYPKPADIIRNLTPAGRSLEEQANIAWMEIEASIKRVGAYGTLEMNDKLALMTIKNMGTWMNICHTPLDKLIWKKKEFIENYKALENTPVEMLPKSLPGITDLSNQRSGNSQSMVNAVKHMKLNKEVN